MDGQINERMNGWINWNRAFSIHLSGIAGINSKGRGQVNETKGDSEILRRPDSHLTCIGSSFPSPPD